MTCERPRHGATSNLRTDVWISLPGRRHMARLTHAATLPRVVCLLLSAMATRAALSADAGSASRYVMAPADPTHAPSDPTRAPADPNFAPADPREIHEPR